MRKHLGVEKKNEWRFVSLSFAGWLLLNVANRKYPACHMFFLTAHQMLFAGLVLGVFKGGREKKFLAAVMLMMTGTLVRNFCESLFACAALIFMGAVMRVREPFLSEAESCVVICASLAVVMTAVWRMSDSHHFLSIFHDGTEKWHAGSGIPEDGSLTGGRFGLRPAAAGYVILAIPMLVITAMFDVAGWGASNGIMVRSGGRLSLYCDQILGHLEFCVLAALSMFVAGVYVLGMDRLSMFDEMGLHEPTSFEDLTEISKTIYEKSGGKTAGAGFLIDMFFYQEALVRSLGCDGIIAKDGSGPACLEDGSLEKVLKDWQDGIQAGYFAHLEVTNTSSVMKEELYNGELGAMLSTSGNLGNFKSQFEELDYELGVCAMPVYGGMGGNIGGGNLGIIGATHSENEIAAAWEFVKFLQRDEATAAFAVNTGYLPITYSCTETDILKKQWEDDPDYRIAFDVLGDCSESSWCQYQNEFESYMKEAASYVVQDFSWTPEEAVKYLEEQASTVFE